MSPTIGEVHSLAYTLDGAPPIESVYAACLLLSRCGDRTTAELNLHRDGTADISLTSCSGHYGLNVDTRCVKISPRIIPELRSLTDPTPQWGWSDERVRVTTSRMLGRIRDFEREINSCMAL